MSHEIIIIMRTRTSCESPSDKIMLIQMLPHLSKRQEGPTQASKTWVIYLFNGLTNECHTSQSIQCERWDWAGCGLPWPCGWPPCPQAQWRVVRGGIGPGVGYLGLVGGPLALRPSGGLLGASASIRHGGLEEECSTKTCSSAERYLKKTVIITESINGNLRVSNSKLLRCGCSMGKDTHPLPTHHPFPYPPPHHGLSATWFPNKFSPTENPV